MHCPECGRPMENVGEDPSQPPDWECKNSRCVGAAFYKDVTCPKCSKRPIRITSPPATGFKEFQCEDGHLFEWFPYAKR